jgi:hypothetical protein
VTPQVLAALIGAIGALAGVATGSLLSAWYQRQTWMRDQAARARDERRRLFAEFLTAAREWRAVTHHPDTKIVRASAISKKSHADGGAAAARALALRSEIALIAQAPTIEATREMARTHRLLAEGRAKYAAGELPGPLVTACRRAELRFVRAARAELGVAGTEEELAAVFGIPVEGSSEPTN